MLMITSTEPRYSLEKGSTKHLCPDCGKKTFVRYVDNQTGQYLNENIGRCDREGNCQAHYKPKDYFEQNPAAKPTDTFKASPKPPEPINYLSPSILEKYTNSYESNILYQWMLTLPGWSLNIAADALQRYKVGTPLKGPYKGACIFWQIDRLGQIRSGKIMKYKPDGHRSKEPYAFNWVHSVMIKKGLIQTYKLEQCLFGLHLSTNNHKPIAIVESEKTAILASVYIPDYTWMACGSATNVEGTVRRSMAGKHVTLYPDFGKAFEDWSQRAIKLNKAGFNVRVSTWLQDYANKYPGEVKEGDDIADVLQHINLLDYRPDLKALYEFDTFDPYNPTP